MEPYQPTIVFVCIGNACRSQMAEGFARHEGKSHWKVFSAGSNPAGFVAPLAIQAMAEKEIDISSQTSKGIPELPTQGFDYVVTMGCGDRCPTLMGNIRLDWEIQDPIGHSLDYFRKIRDEIETRVLGLLESSKEAWKKRN